MAEVTRFSRRSCDFPNHSKCTSGEEEELIGSESVKTSKALGVALSRVFNTHVSGPPETSTPTMDI